MAMDHQCIEEAGVAENFDREGAFSAKHRGSDPGAISVSEDDGNFNCNICLDSVQEPVVTLCGHLFCWPCIHKWLHLQTGSTTDQHDKRHKECPVCKCEISNTTLVPLYGRGRSAAIDESKNTMPRRPIGPAMYRMETPSSAHTNANLRFSQSIDLNNPFRQGSRTRGPMGYYPVTSTVLSSSSLSYSTVLDPVIVMVGEMMSTRLFGTQGTDTFTYPDTYNLTGTSSPRLRRQMMQTDKSLGRICLFLMCCLVLCLLLF